MDAFYYFQCAAFIHGLGDALNISLLWIEIAAFNEMRIAQNIARMKYVLLAAIVSLYVAWIYFGLVHSNYCLVQIVVDGFIIFMIISFGIGAWSLSRILHQRFAHSYTDGQRKQAKDAEIQMIFSNSMGIVALSILFLVFQLVYLGTYKIRSAQLSFFSFMVCCFLFQGINFIVLWHLKGKRLFALRITRTRKQRMKVYANGTDSPPTPMPGPSSEGIKSLSCEMEKGDNN